MCFGLFKTIKTYYFSFKFSIENYEKLVIYWKIEKKYYEIQV